MCLKLKIPKFIFILRHSINNSKILQLVILILKFPYRLMECISSIKTLTNIVIIISIFLGLTVLKKINHFEFIGALIYTTLSFMTVCLGALLIKGKYGKFSNDEKIELLSTMIFFVLTTILQCYIQCNKYNISFLFHLINNSIDNGNNIVLVFKILIVMIFLILVYVVYEKWIKKLFKIIFTILLKIIKIIFYFNKLILVNLIKNLKKALKD